MPHRTLYSFTLAAIFAGAASAATGNATDPATPLLRQYCLSCHGKAAMGGISVEKLLAQPVGDNFAHWRKVAHVLEHKQMPPPKMPQPAEASRTQAVGWVKARLQEYATQHAGDPGRVTVRRLTSGEYGYTIADLTGLQLKFDRDFVPDSVGGEGFTNFGDVQFLENASLERYLEAAKLVASHAVIGAGPLQFWDDPGRSGMELSAIHRIQQIYRKHGFRAASAEGGRPYGLERYGQAFYAAWRYEHRQALGEPTLTLESAAAAEGLSLRFLEHIRGVLLETAPTFPTSDVIARWRQLPGPGVGANRARTMAAAKARCAEIQKFVIDWPRWLFAAGELAAGGQGDERALVLNEESLAVAAQHKFRFFTRRTRGQKTAKVYLWIEGANPTSREKPVVLWRNAQVRFRNADRSAGTAQPLATALDAATRERIGFGRRPDGAALEADAFATVGDTRLAFEVPVPEGAGAIEVQVDAEMVPAAASTAVLRVTVSESEDLGKGRPSWALLGVAGSAGYRAWKDGVLAYAARFPQNSQGEPTPADRDPIPPPFNNTYNQPERDRFHVQLKYFRDDRFVVEKMLDDATRARLDQAWADLLGSFEYHDIFLRFVSEKFQLPLKAAEIGKLDPAAIEALPEEPRKYVRALRSEWDWMRKLQASAEPGHVEDCLRFAAKSWRRPLTAAEKDRLRGFYVRSRETEKLDHPKAVRALLARVLVAPAFLYRLEQTAASSSAQPLTGFELASRLSYFLWSSVPDEELSRAAAAGELSDPAKLERQARRMLADPKARRLGIEFFGQWLGFYRFDQYRGVDTGRFPEFTEDLKSAMYDEAVSFFTHIVRQDRPAREMMAADYTFLNKALAKHYGVTKEIASAREAELVEGARGFQRGGMLRLGAVLTATSAPLRTSPVKRGDWLLRRVLGTPTPPPPADAGSIPADEKQFGGLSLKEKLTAHQRNATCAGCHMRIDPLGFPMEHYDPVGRWRATYSDGKPVEDTSTTFDGRKLAGMEGLVEYLNANERQVLRTFSQKLLGYALGRTVQGSDELLLDRMAGLGGDAKFSQFVAEVVQSKQFRYRRGREAAAPVKAAQVAKKEAGE